MSQGYYDTSYPPSLWAPASTVAGVNPGTAAVGAAGFTMTVNGTGFTEESVVSFEGDPRPTTFVSETQLTATVAGIMAPARTVPVTVSTGGSSDFIVTSAMVQQEGASSPADSPQVPQEAPVVPQEATEQPQGTETAQEPPEASQAT